MTDIAEPHTMMLTGRGRFAPQITGAGFVHDGLDCRVQFGAATPQIGVLVKHQHLRPVPALAEKAHGVAQRIAPLVEADRRRPRVMATQRGSEPVEGGPALLLQRQVVDPAYSFD